MCWIINQIWSYINLACIDCSSQDSQLSNVSFRHVTKFSAVWKAPPKQKFVPCDRPLFFPPSFLACFPLVQSAAAAKRAFISPIYFNTPFFSLFSSQAAADCYITAEVYRVFSYIPNHRSSCITYKEHLADDKFWEICVCVSPTKSKKYTIKPMIQHTYHQPDAP